MTQPKHLRDLGLLIYEHAERKLRELGAVNAWFVEHTEDHRLTSFILERGYSKIRRFQLDSGEEAVVLSKDIADTT